LRPVLRRLFLSTFWVCLSLAVIGAVAIERRQVQKHDNIAQAQEVAPPQQVATAERSTVGRSREASRSKESFQPYTLKKDISYGPAARLKLDLYTPTEPRADGKVVIFLYGGFWSAGSKNEYEYVGDALASRGLTVIIPDYRLYPEVHFPTFIEDCAEATRWAVDHYGADKVFLMGHSAGAHIAMMLASNTPYLAAAGVNRMKLRGAIGLAGPYDFLPLSSTALQEAFGTANDPAILPLTFAKPPLPPILLIHGAGDKTVDAQNSEHLAAAWERAGASADLKLYSGMDHNEILKDITDGQTAKAPTLDDVMAFIDQH
jgi:acetyl esterase/lipase